jgi:FKBP-type peptidyl-prolyl cis-trans isomerase SlyD
MRDEGLVQSVPRSAFQGVPNVAVGMQFRTAGGGSGGVGGGSVVTVTKVDGETVTVDGNHPLAGATLSFDVDIREVRKATQEELAHGHVHGPGGHHH